MVDLALEINYFNNKISRFTVHCINNDIAGTCGNVVVSGAHKKKERATYSANTLIINDVLPLYLSMNVRHIYLTRITGNGVEIIFGLLVECPFYAKFNRTYYF